MIKNVFIINFILEIHFESLADISPPSSLMFSNT